MAGAGGGGRNLGGIVDVIELDGRAAFLGDMEYEAEVEPRGCAVSCLG